MKHTMIVNNHALKRSTAYSSDNHNDGDEEVWIEIETENENRRKWRTEGK